MKFVIAITKGLIRDQHVRRQAMFGIVVAALVMLFSGATFLSGWLDEHWVLLLLFWAACAWLTLTAMLLAIFDLLIVSARARQERRRLRQEIFDKEHGGKPPDV